MPRRRDAKPKVADLTRHDLQRWVARQLNMPPGLARQVARQLPPGADPADPLLLAQAARLSVKIVQQRASALLALSLPRGGGMQPAAIDPISLVGAGAGAALDVLAGTLAKGGWENDGPDRGWKKEQGGALIFFDDGNAPRIGAVRTAELGCCKQPVGVKITLTITVTDDSPGSPGNDSGVRRVTVSAVYPPDPELASDDATGEATLSDADNERSQDQDIDVTVSVCVPCAFITDKGLVLLRVHAIDDDDNERLVVKPIDVSSVRAQCCGGGG